jgi:hypothetical protein
MPSMSTSLAFIQLKQEHYGTESEEYTDHGATGCCRSRTGATSNPASGRLFSVAYDMPTDKRVTEWHKLCADLEQVLSRKPHKDAEIPDWANRVYALYVS